MKNVLVTGSAGFLGSHIVKRFLDLGYKVFGVDNFSTLHFSKFRPSHHENLLLNNNYNFNRDSISNSSFYTKYQHTNFDFIMNFACPASPPVYQKIPVDTTLACTTGVYNVLRLARNCGAVVVHASTSEVYGEPTVSPQSETLRSNVNSYGPRSCYDAGKMAAEALCFDFLNTWQTDVRLVRIFNTYGPHMFPDDGRVVSNFIYQALKGNKLTVYGDGKQTRSFCYVDDLLDGIFALAMLKDNPKAPVNVGNDHEFTVLELAKCVLNTLSVNNEIEFKNLPVDDPTNRRPDLTLARKLLNYKNSISLETGVSRTAGFFKSLM